MHCASRTSTQTLNNHNGVGCRVAWRIFGLGLGLGLMNSELSEPESDFVISEVKLRTNSNYMTTTRVPEKEQVSDVLFKTI